MQKRYNIATLPILVLLLASVACANGLGPTATSTRAPTQTPEPTATPRSQTVTIAGPACPDHFQEHQEQTINKDVEVHANRLFTLTLGSTPSIPCEWHAPEVGDPGVVRPIDHRSKWPAEGMTPVPGAPGTEIWNFETLMEGESAISLNCVCLDEEGSQEEVSGTFVLNVTVEK